MDMDAGDLLFHALFFPRRMRSQKMEDETKGYVGDQLDQLSLFCMSWLLLPISSPFCAKCGTILSGIYCRQEGRRQSFERSKLRQFILLLQYRSPHNGAFFSVSLQRHTHCTTLHMFSIPKLGLWNWYLALWALAVHDSTPPASPGWAKCLKGVALDGGSLWHFHMFAPHRELHRRAMGTILSEFKAWDGQENMPSLQHENPWYWVLSKTFKTQIPETLGQSYTTLKQISGSAVSWNYNPDALLEAGWCEVAIICSICPAPRRGHPTQNSWARPAGLPPDRPQTYKRDIHMTSIAMNRDGNRFLCKTSIQTGNTVF